MTTRRDFLKTSGNIALAGFFTSSIMAEAMAKKDHALGLQLFTLFRVIDAEVEGNLKKVADLGYKDIESAFSLKGGFYGKTALEFDDICKSLGLNWISHHALGAPLKPRPGFNVSKMPKMLTLKNDTDEIINSLKGTSVKYLVCANIPIDNAAEVAEAVEILTKAAQKAKAAGITFCYHNHDKEFEVVEGQRAFDVFASKIPADLLKFELDLGWVSKAGLDPVEIFKQHPGRFPLCHVKDFDKEFKNILPIGQGIIDYKRIFKSSKIAGFKHYFVEHDMPADAFESITTSIKNIRAKNII